MNSITHDTEKAFSDLTVQRFMRYARVWTTSDRHKSETPSTPGQWDLAKLLVEELRGLGISDVILTDHCYVIARIPASPGKENKPAVGFLAHLDTWADVSGENVKPQLVENYDGKPIKLAEGFCLDPALDSGLAAHKGKAFIHADGTTLLGADNKAGIAAVMGAAEYFLTHPEIAHGEVEIVFTPDEETGKGLPEFPLEKLKSKTCFTIDGGHLGELEYECFNAWAVKVSFTGVAQHLGTARGRMVNAALMAAVYATMLPRNESPEATDGYYGYYCPLEMQGDAENASLDIFVRDFDSAEGERRIAALDAFAKAVEAQFPGGKVELKSKVQYRNMKEKINEHPMVLEKLRQAFTNLGIEIIENPIRGGTDGSRLTELGIPTPNFFTGGRNFHSRLEWISVSELAASCRLAVELIKLWAE